MLYCKKNKKNINLMNNYDDKKFILDGININCYKLFVRIKDNIIKLWVMNLVLLY